MKSTGGGRPVTVAGLGVVRESGQRQMYQARSENSIAFPAPKAIFDEVVYHGGITCF